MRRIIRLHTNGIYPTGEPETPNFSHKSAGTAHKVFEAVSK